MHEVMPVGRWLPRIGKTVKVQFSQARFSNDIDLSEFSVSSTKQLDLHPKSRWDAYCEWAYQSLHRLEEELNPSLNQI